MLSVSIQPDILALLFINLCFYFSLKFVRSYQIKYFYLFSISSGLILLIKLHFFVAAYWALLAIILLLLISQKRIHKKIFLHYLFSILIVFFIGGWWYVRSYLLYDNIIGFISSQSSQESFFLSIKIWFFYNSRFIYSSFWGVWGWVDYAYPLFVFFLLFIISFIPLPLWIFQTIKVFKADRKSLYNIKFFNSIRGIDVLVFAAPLALFFFEMIIIAGSSGANNSQGRYWLPFIFPLAVYMGGFLDSFKPLKLTKQPFGKIQLKNIVIAYVVIFTILNVYMIYLTYMRYYVPS